MKITLLTYLLNNLISVANELPVRNISVYLTTPSMTLIFLILYGHSEFMKAPMCHHIQVH